MAREQITWRTRWDIHFSLAFLFFFIFLIFVGFPPFLSSVLAHTYAIVLSARLRFEKNIFLQFLLGGWWLSGSRIEPRRAQMNGHYVYPKWKRGLKWIFNEPGSWGLAQCVAVSWRVILPAKDMLQLNKKKITLKRCGVSTALASLGGQPFVTF